jgi:uncharacterized membrane protein YqjE
MVKPELSGESVPHLIHELGGDLRQLVADEVGLAKAEIKESIHHAIRAAIAAVVALLGAGILLIFGLVVLVEWIPNHTLVAGIVALAGLLLLLVAAAVVWANRQLVPFRHSKQSLKEDLEWARRLSKRAHR